MRDLIANLEALTRAWGERIGRSVAERIATEQAARAPAAPAGAPEAPAQATGLLPGRPGRRRRPGEPPPPCGHPGCERPSRTRGFCQTHYVRWLKASR